MTRPPSGDAHPGGAPEPAPLFAEAEGPPGGTAWWARAADGPRLRLARWPGERGTVILFPGRTEYVEKYGHTALALADRGWGLLTIDWRGQGLSARAGGVRAGHVRRFSDYQDDVAVLMAAAQRLPRPWLMIAHSMGGGIGFRTLTASPTGAPFDAAAFCAPMWGLGITGLRRAAAWGISTLARHARQGHRLTPGTSPLSYVMNTEFATNDLTSDPDEFAWLRRQLSAHPELALGGPSLGWLGEALGEIAWIRRQPMARLPVAVGLGTDERIVDPAAIRRMAAAWPGARLDIYDGARHEILMERPDHRTAFLDRAIALTR